MKRTEKEPAAQETNPDKSEIGDYRADGSWDPEGRRPENQDPNASLYWFVNMLVTKRRRSPATEPYAYALRIGKSHFKAAFPSAIASDPNDPNRWTATIPGRNGSPVPIPFWLVATATSAEAAVFLGGYAKDEQGVKDYMRLFESEARERKDLPDNAFNVKAFVDSVA